MAEEGGGGERKETSEQDVVVDKRKERDKASLLLHVAESTVCDGADDLRGAI